MHWRTTVWIASVFALSAFAVNAARADAEPEVIQLWSGPAPGAVGDEAADRPTLSLYRPAAEKANGAVIVVCPGGGYGHLAVDHEGRQIAEWLNSLGVTAAVLRYRIAPRYHHPAPLLDVSRAIRTVRARAGEWGLDPKRVGVIGFSAGGHLVSSVATHFDAGKPESDDPIERQSSRADLVILGYPVISFTEPFTHIGSRNNLLGTDASAELIESLSSEKQVTAETPPVFLFHSSTDRAVPPENSVAFYLACRAAGVPAELHIYESGPHGFGLGGDDPVLSTWPTLCEAWMKKRGFFGQ